MSNPFKKQETQLPEAAECEGHFGCFTGGCGKVIGNALYYEEIETLVFTCPEGHRNEVSIRL